MREQKVQGKRFRRIVSMVMVLVLLVSILVVPVAAASKSKSVNVKEKSIRQNPVVTVTTGNGLFYAWGWWKTKVTLKNTGRYAISYSQKHGSGNWCSQEWLYPGQSKDIWLVGSNKQHFIGFQRTGGRCTVPVTVTTNAGSIR